MCEATTSSLTNEELVPEARWLTDRYDFLAELGRGGMGIVYLARTRDSQQPVAIKLLGMSHAGNSEGALRFAREARTMAALAHPNIVPTLAIEELDGSALAIVSQYIAGDTLRVILRKNGSLPFERAASILRDIAAALAHAHRRRIVHRDVKPENIFVESGTGRALLSDFGIARPLDAETQLTSVGTSLGTPSYMAPEQVKGIELDERADVYSLGLVGWEMLTGARPWEGETLYDVLHKQQHETLPPLATLRPDIPMYLLVAIEGALSKDPSNRWANGAEMLARLTPTPSALPSKPARNEAPETVQTIPVERANAGSAPIAEVPAVEPRTPTPTEVGRITRIERIDVPDDDDVGREGYTRLYQTPAKQQPPFDIQTEKASPDPSAAASTTPSPHSAQSKLSKKPFISRPLAIAILLLVGLGVLLMVEHRVLFGTDNDASKRKQATQPDTTAPSKAPDTAVAISPPVARDTAHSVVPPSARDTVHAVRPPSARDTARAVRPPIERDTASVKAQIPARVNADGSANASAGDATCSVPTRSAQQECLMRQISRNDIALNRTYQALIARLRQQAGGVREPPSVQSLRVEQRAWIVQRDSACRRVGGASGSLWAMQRAPCFARLSAEREAELRQKLEMGG